MKTQPDAWNFVHRNLCGEWFNGVPLGNGDLGALMMPHHKRITFALAKSDVWDERCDDGAGRRRSFRVAERFATVRALIEQRRWQELERRFEQRNRQWRGKFCLMPAGSLVLDTTRFEKEIELLEFGYQLDMARALGTAAFTTRVRQQTAEALVNAAHQVLAIRVRQKLDWRKGNPPRPMTFGMDIRLDVKPNDPRARVETGRERGVLWTRVRGYHRVDYTIAVLVRGAHTTTDGDRVTVTAKDSAGFVIYAAIVSASECGRGLSAPTVAALRPLPHLEEAIRRVRAAARAGYDRIRADHLRRWRKFWGASRVRIPDRDLLRQYHCGLYLLGASSRRGYPMPGLQGLWSTNPAGSGWNDYTNDLNIQMNYWPIYAGNHLELGWPYYDTVRAWLPATRRFTREYWGCRGVQFSCCASPTGLMPPGYVTTIHWAGHAAFVAQNFWTHWLYSRDEKFLREVAYPFLKECAEFYLDFLRKDRRGRYAIWPSNTPEAGEGGYEAWGKNPTMDIALLRMLFGAIIEGYETLVRSEARSAAECRGGGATPLRCAAWLTTNDAKFIAACRERLAHLPPYPTANGWLIEMESKEFQYSHRHPGMLTPLYPCADVAGRLAARSIDRFIAKGRWLWCGFSPVWVAAAAARVGRGEQARALLREFLEVYTHRQGGLHLNFDHAGTGRGSNGPKCFTNETNSGFSAALLEMLLQSQNGLIRVFPAVPRDWRNVSFENLRTVGGFLVSAARQNGVVGAVNVASTVGGRCRLRNPWGQARLVVTVAGKQLVRAGGREIEFDTRPRTTYSIRPA